MIDFQKSNYLFSVVIFVIMNLPSLGGIGPGGGLVSPEKSN